MIKPNKHYTTLREVKEENPEGFTATLGEIKYIVVDSDKFTPNTRVIPNKTKFIQKEDDLIFIRNYDILGVYDESES